MKIGRRGFISLGLGATAGLTLSPVPWKLLDDVSIWTQNWPWVPVPGEGKVTELNSVCSLCPGGCGITVRKVDERVISIKGWKDFPINKDGLCPLGLSGPQLLYTPSRIMAPMAKVNGAFNEITWEQALKLLKGKFSEFQKLKTPESLACVSDTHRGTVPRLFQRLLSGMGSSGFYHESNSEDTWEAVTAQMFGAPSLPAFDLENTDFVLSLGCGLAEGWGSPVHSMQTLSSWKESGTSLVQIEPRLSNTAAVADQWIAINPGSEADLVMGIVQVIIEKGLHSNRVGQLNASEWTFLKNLVRTDFTPDKVAATTGIEPKIIESLASAFALANRPLALCGKGQARQPGDSREFAAAMLLNMLSGRAGKPGGVHLLSKLEEQVESTPSEGLFSELTNNNLEVELLLLNNSNPCYTQPNSDSVKKAIDRIPFVVNFSPYWDETAVISDLLLPNHSYLERYQDVPVTSGLMEPMVGLSRPVSPKIFNTMDTGDLIIATAQSLGGEIGEAFPWKNYSQYLKSSFDDKWETAIEQGFIRAATSPQKSTNKAISIHGLVQKRGTGQLHSDNSDFPLQLIPKDSIRLSAGAIGSTPFMLKTADDTVLKKDKTVVDIHPVTAGKFGFTEGQDVRLATKFGETIVRLHLNEAMTQEIVGFPRGLGYYHHSEYPTGRGTNYNQLINPDIDPTTGLNSEWTTSCGLSNV
jgi:menaquinone reductase, molybdopterin-binding-like subunit